MPTNQTVSIANATDIRDIKPPIEIGSSLTWLWWTLGALAVVAVVLAVWWLLRRRREAVVIVPPVPAHIRARKNLEDALALIGQPKPFCIAVSDAARHYLEDRFDFHAPERTTEEFLLELSRTNLLTPEQKESLGKFLQSCDLVKFARYEPGEPELRELHGAALRLVEETEPVSVPTSTDATGVEVATRESAS